MSVTIKCEIVILERFSLRDCSHMMSHYLSEFCTLNPLNFPYKNQHCHIPVDSPSLTKVWRQMWTAPKYQKGQHWFGKYSKIMHRGYTCMYVVQSTGSAINFRNNLQMLSSIPSIYDLRFHRLVHIVYEKFDWYIESKHIPHNNK